MGRSLWAVAGGHGVKQAEAAPNSSLLSPDVASLMMLPAPPRWIINSFFHANVTVIYSSLPAPKKILYDLVVRS